MCLQCLNLLLKLADFGSLFLQVMTSDDRSRRHDGDRKHNDKREPHQDGRREAAAVKPVHALRVNELAADAQPRQEGARHPGATLVEKLHEGRVGCLPSQSGPRL